MGQKTGEPEERTKGRHTHLELACVGATQKTRLRKGPEQKLPYWWNAGLPETLVSTGGRRPWEFTVLNDRERRGLRDWG